MKILIASIATTGFLAAAGLGLAGVASADPLGGDSAQDAVSRLQDQGYVVEVQGDTESPLDQCTATDVSGLSGTNSAGQAGVPKGSTVYVTVACDDDHDE